MKTAKHKNLSIFVPHIGCPHRCSFCDQVRISGTRKAPRPREVSRLCDEFLPRDAALGKDYEIAFFGGSFTAVEKSYMVRLLSAAYPFVEEVRAAGIRISTRPDAIDDDILSVLKAYGVTSIELGAQSMDDRVLSANLRGHDARRVWRRSRLIKKRGFSLGLQMMTGMYGERDLFENGLETARQFARIGPETVRIYPTLTLKNTYLGTLYEKGLYRPPSLEDTVRLCARLSRFFESRGIKVIKLGLHADRGMEENLLAGPYHPAFRELVTSRIFMDEALPRLEKLGPGRWEIRVNPAFLSRAVGQKKSCIKEFEKLGYSVRIKPDEKIARGGFEILRPREDSHCI